MFEVFPFIFLISIKYFYLTLHDKNEFQILKSNGISNMHIVSILVFIATLLGIVVLLFFYSISSKLKSNYLDIKNNFSNTNEYLAVVNDSGLWIKEEIEGNIYIIHAEKFDTNEIEQISITELDKYFNNQKTIFAKKGNLSSKNWQLANVLVLDEKGNKKI